MRTGSFDGAASDQKVTVACISQRLATLERDSGKTFISRSTKDMRRFDLTDDGRELAKFLGGWLEELLTMLPIECRDAKRTRSIRNGEV